MLLMEKKIQRKMEEDIVAMIHEECIVKGNKIG